MSASKTYSGIDQKKLEVILTRLRAKNYTVTGNNPYKVTTRVIMINIEIDGVWSHDASTLTMTIIKPANSSLHAQIWAAIDKEIEKL